MSGLQSHWKSLIKPYKVAVNHQKDSTRSASLVFEPLEEGFGVTLGTALRRVILSSLKGAAVTSVRFSNTLHEFSVLPGVKEDVTNILLNLKELQVKLNGDGPCVVRVQASGPRVVTAGMLDGGADVTFLSPDQVVCEISDGGKVDFEITITEGKGYSTALERTQESLPLGTILVDAVFNPIKSCMFFIESTRVGQFTNYDKLTLKVETDGSVSPEDAVGVSARILKEQLSKMIHFKEEDFEEEAPPQKAPLAFNPNLLRRVDELDLSLRASNCLKKENIIYIGDLVTKNENELLRAPNFGRKSLSEINDILDQIDLHLGMSIPGWPPANIDELLKKAKDTLATEPKE
ncbi:MAG: DNA-directed RNA polymerase subunit alpha [Holosporaceae bacterium]